MIKEILNASGFKKIVNDFGRDKFYYSRPLNLNNNGFLIYPNIPHAKYSNYKLHPKQIKDFPGGIVLCAWSIHYNFKNTPAILSLLHGVSNRWLDYPYNNETMKSIEEKSKHKYLTTILDLDYNELHQLKKLRKDIFEHLKEVYAVNPLKDKIKLFFHFPIDPTQATLHLHIRVNVGDHPRNMASSFDLDHIINHLEKRLPISQLVTSRFNGKIYTTTAGPFKDVVDAKEIDNPFRLYSLNESFEINGYF